MNKRYSMLFTIAAVAIVSATLFGSTYTQTQIGGTTLEASSTKDDLMQKIHDMGGLELVMPHAFAETYSAMTFSQQIPGPTVRVTQGDIIKMTLTIPSDEVTAHGNDMHASQMSSGNFGKVLPGTSKTYCYIAESAGVFKYHCSGVDLLGMDQHVLSGMYGIAIVDPANGYKKLMVEKTSGSGELARKLYDADALEFQLQYNQLYLTDAGTYDAGAMFQHHNTHTVVNGLSFPYVPNMVHNLLLTGNPGKNIFIAQPWNALELKQYQSQLFYVELDQHVRIFVENH